MGNGEEGEKSRKEARRELEKDEQYPVCSFYCSFFINGQLALFFFFGFQTCNKTGNSLETLIGL